MSAEKALVAEGDRIRCAGRDIQGHGNGTPFNRVESRVRNMKIASPKLPREAALRAGALDDLAEEVTLTAMSIKQQARPALNAKLATIQQSRLTKIDIAGSDLTGMTAIDTRLDGCDLSNVIVANARWTRVELDGCKLTGMVMSQSLLQDVRLTECRADYAQLTMKSQRVSFAHCNLHHTFFNDTDLTGVAFHSCDLGEADFTNAVLDGADFRGSNLDNIVVMIEQLRGVTVSSDQALYLCGLVGLHIDDSVPPVS